MGIRKYRGHIVVDKRWPDGERITRRCQNRTTAKELLSRIEASIADGSWRPFRENLRLRNRGAVTLRNFVQTYVDEYVKTHNKANTLRRKMTTLRRAIASPLGRMELKSISPAHLHQFIKMRKDEGVTNTSINRDLTTLKHLLNFAEECGVIEVNLVAKFKRLRVEEKAVPRYTDEEIQSVIDAVRWDCRPLFIFIRETGCRLQEAVLLEHWQVQVKERVVVFSHNTKSGKYRYVPLTREAIEAVTALLPLEGCPYVFYNQRTKSRWSSCQKHWDKARKSAEVPALRIKDLRSHFAIKLAESGAQMHDIQQVLGHSSVAVTERHYAQFSPEHSSKKVLRVLEGGKRNGNKTETCSEVA